MNGTCNLLFWKSKITTDLPNIVAWKVQKLVDTAVAVLEYAPAGETVHNNLKSVS